VRIYSAPLTRAEIEGAMRGDAINPSRSTRSGIHDVDLAKSDSCRKLTEPADSILPALAALAGALLAYSWITFRPEAPRWVCAGIGLAAGIVIVACATPDLPSFNRWLIPLTSGVGAISVAVSRRGQTIDVAAPQ
jgi:hypothetical protein